VVDLGRRRAEPAPARGRGAGRPVAGLLLLATAEWATLHAGSPNDARWRLLLLLILTWAAFALAAALLLRTPVRVAVPLLLVGALLLQVLAVAVAPQSTDDFYRYAWDGRVQAAGTDPYHYPPVAPQLAGLRDDWLFPPDCPSAPAGSPPCTRMNHPTDRTIYPPVAQLWFLAVHYASPPGSRQLPLQVGAALLALATAVLLVGVLRRTRGDPRLAVLWAWCPLVPLEAGNNAHVDVLGALLTVAALGLVALRRPAWGGLALGAAIAVKVLPALVLPAVLARRPGRLLGAASALLVAVYLPHVLAVGPDVVGFLPGYLHEEGYGGSGRFALVRLVAPRALAPAVAVLTLAVVAFRVLRRSSPDRPWSGALVVTGAAFLLAGPSYPWYAVLLVALVALDGRWEWLTVALAGYPAYFAGPLGVNHALLQRCAYGAALAVVLAVGWHRRTAAAAAATAPVAAD